MPMRFILLLSCIGACLPFDESDYVSKPAIEERSYTARTGHAFLPGDWRKCDTNFVRALVIPKYKLLLCTVPKCSSTTLRAFAEDLLGLHMDNIHDNLALKEHNLDRRPISEVRVLINDPSWIKIAFVRNPYVRAVSAWHDKCRIKREPWRPCYGQNISFDAFIEDIVHDPQQNQEHFRLTSCFCGMRYIPYEVAPVEHFNEELQKLIQRLRCGKDLTRNYLRQRLNAYNVSTSRHLRHFSTQQQHRFYTAFEEDFKRLGYPYEFPT